MIPSSFSSLYWYWATQLLICMNMYTEYTTRTYTIKRKTHKLNKTFSLFKVNAGEIGDSTPTHSNISLFLSLFTTHRILVLRCNVKFYFPFRQAQIDLFCIVYVLCLTWQRLVADRIIHVHTLHWHGIIFLSANIHIWALKLNTNEKRLCSVP